VIISHPTVDAIPMKDMTAVYKPLDLVFGLKLAETDGAALRQVFYDRQLRELDHR
jgi:hypothetical protein